MALYITSVSFEDRCLALADDLAETDRQGLVVVLDFGGYENVDPYLVNRARLAQRLTEIGVSMVRLLVNVDAPLDGETKLRKVLARVGPTRAVLDISTLPRNYLFTVCRLLCELGIGTVIRYYKPLTYGGQLSRGVGQVQSIPGFEGSAVGGGNSVLIMVLGFEGYKSLYAWEELGPSKAILLLGDPPYRHDFLETARSSNGELFRQLGSRGEVRRLHTYDIPVARMQLQRLYECLRQQDPNVEVTLCPLGTKPQSVAAFAFAYSHREVAIAYVSSLMYYTGDYSRGYDPKYVETSLQGLIVHDENPRRP